MSFVVVEMTTAGDNEASAYEHTLTGDVLRRLLTSSVTSLGTSSATPNNNNALVLRGDNVDSENEFNVTLSPANFRFVTLFVLVVYIV